MTDTGKAVIELSANALKVLQRRYLKKGENGEVLETPEEMFRRVARAIAQAERLYNPAAPVEEWEETFYELMTSLEFLPNTPTLMNAGRELGQLSACFVLPVGDSMESIFEAVKNTALIHKSGGGTGFSFSRLRPQNDVVHSTKGVSSGPLSFMSVFDAATETIKQGGTRRGANMGILRVDHPDILDFITRQAGRRPAQQLQHLGGHHRRVHGRRRGGRGVRAGQPALRRDGRARCSARKVFKSIVTLAWKNGDPGIVFIDRINAGQPHAAARRDREHQPLRRAAAAALRDLQPGLDQPVARSSPDGARRLRRAWAASCAPRVHFLDNVIDVNRYPLPEIEQMTTRQPQDRPRASWASPTCCCACGIPYDSDEAVPHRRRGHELHPRRGARGERRTRPRARRLPQLRGLHLRHAGRARACATPPSRPSRPPAPSASSPAAPAASSRSSRSASSAPTSWTTTAWSRCTPYFEQVAQERGFYSDELMKKIAEVRLRAAPRRRARGRAAGVRHRPRHHARVAHQLQAAFQKHTDNAVSKTVNFPNDATVDDVENVYLHGVPHRLQGRHHLPRRQPRRAGAQRRPDQEEARARAGSSASPPRAPARPQLLTGETQRMDTGCGKLFVIMNDDEYGPREVFANMGKAGGLRLEQHRGARPAHLARAQEGRVGARGRRAAQGHPLPRALRHRPQRDAQLRRRHRQGDRAALRHRRRRRRPAHVPEPQLSLVEVAQGACPDCGGSIEHEGGCVVCRTCGYSKCG